MFEKSDNNEFLSKKWRNLSHEKLVEVCVYLELSLAVMCDKQRDWLDEKKHLLAEIGKFNELVATDKSINVAINYIGNRSYDGCLSRGFDAMLQDDAKALLLIHSEISEAVEWLRSGNPNSDHISCTGIEEELADVIIRACVYAHAKNFDLSGAILKKMAFNDSREYKHGQKAF